MFIMCTLHYSVNSHRKIVHLSHCKVLRRIPKESRRSFESLEEAKAHGYRLCRCCPSIAQKYRKERNQVKRFCRDHDFTFMLLNDVIHVISRHDCWRIITCGNNKRLFLYHKNTAKCIRDEKMPGIIPGYHSQNCRSGTILGYLKYINYHDRYRDKHPCTESKAPARNKACPASKKTAKKNEKENIAAVSQKNKPGKGTKRYRKQQARKKREKRLAAIIRVHALLDELAVIGY